MPSCGTNTEDILGLNKNGFSHMDLQVEQVFLLFNIDGVKHRHMIGKGPLWL
jgi:hypothetical protein